MTTIVTAFIVSNTRSDRSISTYLELGRTLLECKVPTVLFMDDAYLDFFEPMEHVHMIPVNKASLELNAHREQFTQFKLTTNNPSKDTLDYVILMCSKTEFICKASQLNPFHTEHFVWVDFGIHHLFAGNVPLFTEAIKSLQYEGDQIRIGRIWGPRVTWNPGDIYHTIAWYFAGGIFGGKRPALLEFEIQMKKKCIEIIRERNSLMWEVNVWRLIYVENPTLFSLYECNHHPSLLLNYKQ